jgi:hypothetical protein
VRPLRKLIRSSAELGLSASGSSREVEGKLAFWVRRRRLRRRFRKRAGRAGNFENPRTYEEKLAFRKLYGNHETYARVADKVGVRNYVAERVGEQYLVPSLGIHDRLCPEVFDALPRQFIIKANHGCSWNKIVYDKEKLDVSETIRYFDGRLTETFGVKTGEFHYNLIEPKVLIEELLLDEGRIPCDYNLYCYHHDGHFDFAIGMRFPDGRPSVQFDKHWNLLEGELSPADREKLVDPENFDEMLSVARALSEGFDFMRVDLYNVQGRVYFGELTCTPGAGLSLVKHQVRAAMRTGMWSLDVDNPRLYRKPRARRCW